MSSPRPRTTAFYFTDNTGDRSHIPAHGPPPPAPAKGTSFSGPTFTGERLIFRKGDPIAQIVFVPDPVKYTINRMTLEEAAQRRELEESIETYRMDIAEHVWRNPAGFAFNNHYKVLARAFARDGLPGVKEVVKKTIEEREKAIPKNLTIPEYMALGMQRIREQKYEQAEQLFTDILSRDPNNARAHSALGVCYDFHQGNSV